MLRVLGTADARQQRVKTTLVIPVWNNQVSTTFDFAETLLVVVVDGVRELSRKEVPLRDEPIDRRVRSIRDAGTQVLLCGAISQPLARAMSRAGIRVIPYVAGPVEDVLQAFIRGCLDNPRFLLPGTEPAARRELLNSRGAVRWILGNQALERTPPRDARAK